MENMLASPHCKTRGKHKKVHQFRDNSTLKLNASKTTCTFNNYKSIACNFKKILEQFSINKQSKVGNYSRKIFK